MADNNVVYPTKVDNEVVEQEVFAYVLLTYGTLPADVTLYEHEGIDPDAEEGEHTGYADIEFNDSLVASITLNVYWSDSGEADINDDENLTWLTLRNGMGFKLKSMPYTEEEMRDNETAKNLLDW